MKYYFDTALFIYALETKSEQAKKLFQDALLDGRVGTSVVTVMEYCTGCIKNDAYVSVEKFVDFLHDYDFELHRVDEETAMIAARVRAKYPAFKQMDALQIASAIAAKADVFYTNDKQLIQFKHSITKVVRPDC